MASVGLPYVNNVPSMGGGLSLSNDAPNFAYNVNTATKGLNLLSGLLDLSKAKGDQLTKARLKTYNGLLKEFSSRANKLDEAGIPHDTWEVLDSAKKDLTQASLNFKDPSSDEKFKEKIMYLTDKLHNSPAIEALKGTQQEKAQLERINRQNSLKSAQAVPIKQEVEGRLALSKLGQAQPEDRSHAELMSRAMSPMGAGNAVIPARPRTREEIGSTVQNVPPALLAGLSLGKGQGGQQIQKPKMKETFESGLPKQVATIMNDVAKKHENPEGIKQAFTNVFSSIKSVLTGKDANEFLSLPPKEQKYQVEQTLNDAGIDVSTLSPNAKSKLAFAVRVELMKLKSKKVKTTESSLDEKINKLVQ